MKTRKAKPNDWTKDYSIERDHKSYSDEPQPQHTPTPWKMNDNAVIFNGPWIANCRAGIKQAPTSKVSLANAAFIVRACNSHSDLLAIVKQMVFNHEHGDSFNECDWKYIDNSIAKAEGV